MYLELNIILFSPHQETSFNQLFDTMNGYHHQCVIILHVSHAVVLKTS